MDSAGAATRDAALQPNVIEALAGKYMTFQLDREAYGVEITKVREIIGVMSITRVPRAPDALRGVINLRGKVIPVMDLRVKFGMPRADDTDQTVIIVVQCQAAGHELTMGVLVDQVLEVLSIGADAIEPPPCLGGINFDTKFILGVGKTGNHVVFLIDIGAVLTETDARAYSSAALVS